MSFGCGSVDCLSFMMSWGSVSSNTYVGLRWHMTIAILAFGEVEARRLGVLGHLWLHSKFQDSLGYMKLYLKERGARARGPLGCWTYTLYQNYSTSFLSIPVWPKEWAWYPGTEQWCQAKM